MNQDQDLNISKRLRAHWRGLELVLCVAYKGLYVCRTDKQGLSRGNFNTSDRKERGERNRRADVCIFL